MKLTKFSQCVPRRQLSWSSSAFFRPIRHVESTSGLVGQSGHLIILIGYSAGEPVREKSAEWTCYWPLGVERRLGVSGQLWTQTLPTPQSAFVATS